jgi:hypothetical protein
MRRKSYGFVFMSLFAEIRLPGTFLTNSAGGCNPHAPFRRIPVAQRQFPAMKT